MSHKFTETVDAVVVGTGSGGAPAARGLVDAGLDVLVLEAGPPDDHPAIHDPRRSHDLWGSEVDWDYVTTPQGAAAGRTLHLPRGKVAGGSSAMNGMIWVRGWHGDFDHWAYLGNDGWTFADVLPTFKAIEDFDRGASALHGAGGPLHILTEYEPHEVHRAIVESGVDAGLPYNGDHNGETLDGIGYMQFTIKDGQRQSAFGAFLGPVLDHPNLTVRYRSHATRLLWSGTRCVGVEYREGGRLHTVGVTGEVIVAAGAYESPKLLMLSGVGPEEHLRQHGIEVRADLPGVGQNLHDHTVCPVIFAAPGELPPGVPGLPEMQSHLFWRSRPGLPAPDVQPLNFLAPHYAPWMDGPADAYTLNAGVVRPASRGSVRLASADAASAPIVDPQFLACEIDVDTMAAAVELCREIGRQRPLGPYTDREVYPGPHVTSTAEVREYVRRATSTYHHPVGTCKMGVDADAVVDPRLRVRGVEGVRVADASVMPSVTSGNTHAPTVMIGARAAAFVTGRDTAHATAAASHA